MQGCAGGEDPDLCITSDTTFMPGEDFRVPMQTAALEGGAHMTGTTRWAYGAKLLQRAIALHHCIAASPSLLLSVVVVVVVVVVDSVRVESMCVCVCVCVCVLSVLREQKQNN